jgi:hypothetical protein
VRVLQHSPLVSFARNIGTRVSYLVRDTPKAWSIVVTSSFSLDAVVASLTYVLGHV